MRPKPADLTAPHANAHTAGDLFWWLSHGVKNTSMPGFEQSLGEEERWDLINFMRALSSGDRARILAPVIENEPWLVAPDFTYVTNAGEAKTLEIIGATESSCCLARCESNGARLKDSLAPCPNSDPEMSR